MSTKKHINMLSFQLRILRAVESANMEQIYWDSKSYGEDNNLGKGVVQQIVADVFTPFGKGISKQTVRSKVGTTVNIFVESSGRSVPDDIMGSVTDPNQDLEESIKSLVKDVHMTENKEYFSLLLLACQLHYNHDPKLSWEDMERLTRPSPKSDTVLDVPFVDIKEQEGIKTELVKVKGQLTKAESAHAKATENLKPETVKAYNSAYDKVESLKRQHDDLETKLAKASSKTYFDVLKAGIATVAKDVGILFVA
jgi:hypothetical protein